MGDMDDDLFALKKKSSAQTKPLHNEGPKKDSPTVSNIKPEGGNSMQCSSIDCFLLLASHSQQLWSLQWSCVPLLTQMNPPQVRRSQTLHLCLLHTRSLASLVSKLPWPSHLWHWHSSLEVYLQLYSFVLSISNCCVHLDHDGDDEGLGQNLQTKGTPLELCVCV